MLVLLKKRIIYRVIYNEDKNTEKIANKEDSETLVKQLLDLGVKPEQLAYNQVKIEIVPPSQWLGLLTALGYIMPFLILGGVFWFVFRQAQGSNNAAMSFGKSRARMFTGDQPTVTFEDVAGVEEAKEELRKWSSSCVSQRNSSRWVRAFLKVFCWLVLQAPVKPCSPRQFPAKPGSLLLNFWF